MSVVTRPLTVLSSSSVLSSPRYGSARLAVAALAPGALAAVLSDAAPTGIAGVDAFWIVAFVGSVAYLSGTARRWTWFLPAGIAAALAGDAVALAVAAGAIVLGFWSVVTDTRTRPRGALVGGLGAAALLQAGPFGFHGSTAVISLAAVVPIAVSGYQHARPRSRKRIRRVAEVAGGVVALVVAGAVLGLVSTQSDLVKGARLIDEGLSAARRADDDLAGERLGQAARHLHSADVTLSGWFVAPARLLPAVGPNIDAVESLAREAGQVASVTSAAAETADIDALRFIGGRLDPQIVADMEEPLEESLGAVEGLRTTVDASVYSPWVVAPLGDRMDLLAGQLDDAIPDGEAALTAVEQAPSLLGADGAKRYLVLFVTPVEARGRSGFPGNYAELVLDDGQLTMPRFGRISELEEGGVPGPQRTLTEPPEFVARYGRFDPQWTWRNVTMSPDFPTVAAAIQQMYPQSGGAEIDGVLAIDPVGLAALLRYTGPVEIAGVPTPLDENNAARFLLLDQYVTFPDVSQRVDVLETVARTTFERLTNADLPSPRDVAEQLDPLVDGGHIQFTTYDVPQFVWFDSFGLAGRLGDLEADGLAVTSSNAGGSKIDLFLKRTLRYDAAWDPATGNTSGTITSTLTNDAPATGLPDYVIGNVIGLPVGTNRSYVSIYTPLDVGAVRINGQPASMGTGRELDRNVYSTFVDIPPGGTVTIELDVTGVIAGERYVLDMAQQPLVNPELAEVHVAVGGEGSLRARGPDATVDGRTLTWSGALDRRVRVGVTPSD
jgi:hypothetical protein